MLFRSTDLLNDFERLTKGLNLGPEFDRTVDDLSTKFTSTFAGGPEPRCSPFRRPLCTLY